MRLGRLGALTAVAAFVAVLCCAGAATAQSNQCPFFSDGRAPSRQSSLSNCTYYTGNACCRQSELTAIFSELPKLDARGRDPSKCYEAMNILLCYVCSPAQGNFYRNDVPVMCRETCDRAYRECRRFAYNGVTIEEAYGSGTEFCNAQGFRVERYTGFDYIGTAIYDTCHIYFNSAAAMRPSLAVMLAGLIVSCLLAVGVPAPTPASTMKRIAPSEPSSRHSLRQSLAIFTIFSVLVCIAGVGFVAQPALSQDIIARAAALGDKINAVQANGVRSNVLQNVFDNTPYTTTKMNITERVAIVSNRLAQFFIEKEALVMNLATAAQGLYRTDAVPLASFPDTDVVATLPELRFDPLYNTNVSFAASGIKVSSHEDRPSAAIDNDIAWTAGLDASGVFTDNMNADPDIRWQYIGTEEGVYRQFPARRWQTNSFGFPNEYDPRIRPWYISSLSGPKDIVIVLDCSSSMKNEKWTDATAIVKFVLNSLGSSDRYNVVCARRSYKTYYDRLIYRRTEVLSCRRNQLLRASPTNIEQSILRLGQVVPDGGTNPYAGLSIAYSLLEGQCHDATAPCPATPPRTDCTQLIIFITDGKDQDPDVRCGNSYYRYTNNGRQYVPPPICRFDFGSAINLARSRSHIPIFSYGISTSRLPVSGRRDGDFLPGTVACATGGSFQYVFQSRGLYRTLYEYFRFLTETSEETEIEWTDPYVDALGLGLLMTVSAPVLVNNKRVGVVGIDVTLESLTAFLAEEEWGEVYSILLNDRGDTIVHPLLSSPDDITVPLFPALRDLEQDYNDDTEQFEPTSFDAVNALVKNRQKGVVLISDARRAIPQGDRSSGLTVYSEPVEYHVTPVPGSDLMFVFAVPTKEIFFEIPQAPHVQHDVYLHTMELYDETNREILLQDRQIITTLPLENITTAVPPTYAAKYASLMRELRSSNDPLYPNLFISRAHMTSKPAPLSFCDSIEYVNRINDPNFFDVIEAHIHDNTTTINPDTPCPSGFFELNVLGDLRRVQHMEVPWLARTAGDTEDVIWTYVGTEAGVTAFYPGVRLPHRYDPRTRPWYRQAFDVRNRALPSIVTTPYLDISGSGKIITIATPVFRGRNASSLEACTTYLDCCDGTDCRRSCYNTDGQCLGGEANCFCSSDDISAIASVDMQYTRFHDLVNDFVPECQSSECYVIDRSGLLVYAPDFYDLPDEQDRFYHQIGMGRIDGGIMRALERSDLFSRVAFVDYQGTCSSAPPFDPVTLKGLTEALPPRYRDLLGKFPGPQPKYQFTSTCPNDVLGFNILPDALPDGMRFASGTIDHNPCSTPYTFEATSIPATNLYLVVVSGRQMRNTPIPLNCHMFNRALDAGSFPIANETCSDVTTENEPSLRSQGLCPVTMPYTPPCIFNSASTAQPLFLAMAALVLVALAFNAPSLHR